MENRLSGRKLLRYFGPVFFRSFAKPSPSRQGNDSSARDLFERALTASCITTTKTQSFRLPPPHTHSLILTFLPFSNLLDMALPIQPLITFKAGKCTGDVSLLLRQPYVMFKLTSVHKSQIKCIPEPGLLYLYMAMEDGASILSSTISI
jgi:hypothetical protein